MGAALARLKAAHEAATDGNWQARPGDFGASVHSGIAKVAYCGECWAWSASKDQTASIGKTQARNNAACIALDHAVSAAALDMLESELCNLTTWIEEVHKGNMRQATAFGADRKILRLAWYIAQWDERTAAELAKEQEHDANR